MHRTTIIKKRQQREIYSNKSVFLDYSKPGKLFIFCVSDGAAGDFFFFFFRKKKENVKKKNKPKYLKANILEKSLLLLLML